MAQPSHNSLSFPSAPGGGTLPLASLLETLGGPLTPQERDTATRVDECWDLTPQRDLAGNISTHNGEQHYHLSPRKETQIPWESMTFTIPEHFLRTFGGDRDRFFGWVATLGRVPRPDEMVRPVGTVSSRILANGGRWAEGDAFPLPPGGPRYYAQTLHKIPGLLAFPPMEGGDGAGTPFFIGILPKGCVTVGTCQFENVLEIGLGQFHQPVEALGRRLHSVIDEVTQYLRGPSTFKTTDTNRDTFARSMLQQVLGVEHRRNEWMPDDTVRFFVKSLCQVLSQNSEHKRRTKIRVGSILENTKVVQIGDLSFTTFSFPNFGGRQTVIPHDLDYSRLPGWCFMLGKPFPHRCDVPKLRQMLQGAKAPKAPPPGRLQQMLDATLADSRPTR